jgi:2-dehydropantoate 2-reductase
MAQIIDSNTRIAIYGAGSIGCFVGGLLLRAGRKVSFLARPRIAGELAAYGLSLTDLSGLQAHIALGSLDIETEADFLCDAGLVLLTVKSGDTEAAAQKIAALTAPEVPVVSLQNGVDNPGVLRSSLGQDRVLAGMVEFNVVNKGKACFHRGTSGAVAIEAGRPDIERALAVPGLRIVPAANIAGIQWGKLLFNLNNGLNALSNIPLQKQLQNRAWRQLLASQIAEALAILEAAGVRPVGTNKIPLAYVPRILRLPNALFKIVARPMLRVDPDARSSTWEDLTQGRATEINQFQGALVRLAQQHGLKAPVSETVLRLVKEAEAARAGPPGLSPAAISQQQGINRK